MPNEELEEVPQFHWPITKKTQKWQLYISPGHNKLLNAVRIFQKLIHHFLDFPRQDSIPILTVESQHLPSKTNKKYKILLYQFHTIDCGEDSSESKPSLFSDSARNRMSSSVWRAAISNSCKILKTQNISKMSKHLTNFSS